MNSSLIKIKKDFEIIQKKNLRSTNNKMYQIASCSKFIIYIVVGKLYELGKIDYDTDINKYLKKWKCPAKKITLRHLLTHTSGIIGDGFKGYDITNTKLPSNIDILNGNGNSKKIEFIDKPGNTYKYSGIGYQVIQQVLEELTGKKLYQLMDKYIFKPLKLKNSTGKVLYPKKHKYNLSQLKNWNYRLYPETAAAGVWMSTNDLLKIVIDLSNGYRTNTSKLLKNETLMSFLNDLQNQMLNFKFFKNEINIFHGGSNKGYYTIMECYPMLGECFIIMVNYDPDKHTKIKVKEYIKKNKLK